MKWAAGRGEEWPSLVLPNVLTLTLQGCWAPHCWHLQTEGHSSWAGEGERREEAREKERKEESVGVMVESGMFSEVSHCPGTLYHIGRQL